MRTMRVRDALIRVRDALIRVRDALNVHCIKGSVHINMVYERWGAGVE